MTANQDQVPSQILIMSACVILDLRVKTSSNFCVLIVREIEIKRAQGRGQLIERTEPYDRARNRWTVPDPGDSQLNRRDAQLLCVF